MATIGRQKAPTPTTSAPDFVQQLATRLDWTPILVGSSVILLLGTQKAVNPTPVSVYLCLCLVQYLPSPAQPSLAVAPIAAPQIV